jgi:L-lactate dehydrogenase complex protein LldF
MHLILVDNGRTEQMSRPEFRSSLHCIRCGACMNTCPIYRRSGGHSYGSVIPGPIGSILSPGFDLKKHASLPFASTLCGSCTDVCPVKIDIHHQLYKWRQIITKNQAQVLKKSLMQIGGKIFGHPKLYHPMTKTLKESLKIAPKWITYSNVNKWGWQRDLPDTPAESFTEWYKKNRNKL